MTDHHDPTCQACPLWASARTVCVPGEGPLDSTLLVVGIAPGQAEDAKGQPFVGKSGRLLRQILFDNNLTPRLTNVVRCRPFNTETNENRDPQSDEVKACAQYLQAEIAAMPNLKFVVALGSLPMHALGVRGSVIDLAGVPRRVTLYGRDLLVVPVAHPAAIVRAPKNISTWESHWHQIRELVHPRAVSFSDTVGATILPEGIAETTREVLMTSSQPPALRSMTRGLWDLPIAVDLETTSLEADRGSVLSCAISDGVSTAAWWIAAPGDLVAAGEILGGSGAYRRVIVHSAQMEGRWAETFFGHDRERIATSMIDTQLLAYRVNPGQPMSLASCAARFLPELSGWKRETESLLKDDEGVSMLELPREEVLHRNAVDAHVTRKLFDVLRPQITEEEWTLHSEDVAISMCNARMARRGMLLDDDALIALRKELLATMERERTWFVQQTGIADFNPGSTQQLGRMFAARNIPLPKTPTGAPSTNGMDLRILRHDTKDPKTVELVDRILAYRKAQDVLGDNVTGYATRRSADGRVRSSLFWPGTVTWRPASRDPNLLNVPRTGVRHLFKAPPGMAFMEIDLSQVELRGMAAASGDPVLLQGYRDGADFHTRRAQMIYGRQEITKAERYVGKKVNFSCGYGIGDMTLWESFAKEDVHLPMEVVRNGRRSFWKDFAVLGQYREDRLKAILAGEPQYGLTGGYHWTIDDMHLLHPRDEDEAAGSCYNATIQSMPPRLMYRVALKLEHQIEIVLLTYDGIIAYVPLDSVVEVGRRVREVVREVTEAVRWPHPIEIPADIKAGPNWQAVQEVAV